MVCFEVGISASRISTLTTRISTKLKRTLKRNRYLTGLSADGDWRRIAVIVTSGCFARCKLVFTYSYKRHYQNLVNNSSRRMRSDFARGNFNLPNLTPNWVKGINIKKAPIGSDFLSDLVFRCIGLTPRLELRSCYYCGNKHEERSHLVQPTFT